MVKKGIVAILGIAVVCIAALWILSRSDTVETDSELLEAIRRGNVSDIRAYLARGGSPDRYIDVFGRRMSLLAAAVVDREEDIALALIDNGADWQSSGIAIQDVGRNGLDRLLSSVLPSMPFIAGEQREYTGIVDAALNGYYRTVEVYLDYADGEEWESELNRAAAGALIAGYDDVARLLVERGAPLSELMHVAARFSSPGMVRYLLSRNADPDLALALPPDEVPAERRPIEFAWRRYVEEREYYADLPVDSPILAYRNDDAAYVLFELGRAGADLNTEGWSRVARDGLAELAGLSGRERLLRAAHIGLYDSVTLALSSDDGLTPTDLRDALLIAMEKDHDDIARQLLLDGAPPDGGPLHIAAAASSPGMIRRLLGLGASTDERYQGKEPLQFWLEQNVTEDPELILHELIVGGANACWLVDTENSLPGMSADILKHSAPACWDE